MMFSATLKLETSCSSWWIVAMPSASDTFVLGIRVGRPSTMI